MAMFAVLVSVLALGAALPLDDVIIRKHEPQRYHYVADGDGQEHLADAWVTLRDLQEISRFNPDSQNQYHLFTRANPSWSQPLIINNHNLLWSSNFNAHRKTVVIIHGWRNDVTSEVNNVLTPGYLAAEDVNVIVVDWSAGASHLNYFTALDYAVNSGHAIARFLNWLNSASGANPNNYHLIGHSLGGHQAGIIGRNMNGSPAYVTALDPAFPGWTGNEHRFGPDCGGYTEVIHTNAGLLGYLSDLGHVDFYPNGGVSMPGCGGQACDHGRAYFYMAESLQSGGFRGTRCASYLTAMAGSCVLWGSLNMGGTQPKTGSSGIYHLTTNAGPPFSQG